MRLEAKIDLWRCKRCGEEMQMGFMAVHRCPDGEPGDFEAVANVIELQDGEPIQERRESTVNPERNPERSASGEAAENLEGTEARAGLENSEKISGGVEPARVRKTRANLAGASECSRCHAPWKPEMRRALKLVDGEPVCSDCMTREELLTIVREFLEKREKRVANRRPVDVDEEDPGEVVGLTFTAAQVLRGWMKYGRFGRPTSFVLDSERCWIEQQQLNGQPGRADYEIVALQYAHVEWFFIERSRWAPLRAFIMENSLEERAEFDEDFAKWYVDRPLSYFPEVREMLVHSWEDLLPIRFEDIDEVPTKTLHTWRSRGMLDAWQFEGRWYTTLFFVRMRKGVSRKGGARENAGRPKKVESFCASSA